MTIFYDELTLLIAVYGAVFLCTCLFIWRIWVTTKDINPYGPCPRCGGSTKNPPFYDANGVIATCTLCGGGIGYVVVRRNNTTAFDCLTGARE